MGGGGATWVVWVRWTGLTKADSEVDGHASRPMLAGRSRTWIAIRVQSDEELLKRRGRDGTRGCCCCREQLFGAGNGDCVVLVGETGGWTGGIFLWGRGAGALTMTGQGEWSSENPGTERVYREKSKWRRWARAGRWWWWVGHRRCIFILFFLLLIVVVKLLWWHRTGGRVFFFPWSWPTGEIRGIDYLPMCGLGGEAPHSR